MMMVDIQGCFSPSENKYILTDPAFHTDTGVGFGETNMGKNGFNSFFDSHTCGPICQHLSLPGSEIKIGSCRAIYDFESSTEGDLHFLCGDIIGITQKPGNWWFGTLEGRFGTFPSNYVQEIDLIS